MFLLFILLAFIVPSNLKQHIKKKSLNQLFGRLITAPASEAWTVAELKGRLNK